MKTKRKNKNAPLLVQQPRKIVHALCTLIALILLMVLPFVTHAQNNAAKLSVYPRLFVLKGDSVGIISVPQIRTINRVFNQRNDFAQQIRSLNIENSYLRQSAAQKDSANNLATQQLLIKDDVIKEREQENVDFANQFKALQAADKKTIRGLRIKNVVLYGLIGGLGYLYFTK